MPEDLVSNSEISGQALPAGARLEEFVIERVLGSGGFGTTYLAKDTSVGREVVIKENLPAQFAWRETTTGIVGPRSTTGGDAEDFEWSLKNFLREAETLASLEHPGIVRLLRMFEANGTAYFVMPFVEGATFDSLIESRKSKGQVFSEEELRGFLGYLLEALDYLHERGIYHRDIKPGNVLVTMDGEPILIDFGSARQRLGERSMTVVESAGYTPFEQLQSRGNIGPWSDLYSLGATLVKAITFELIPKAADRVIDDPWLGLAGNPEWEGLYGHEFLASVDRATAVDPKDRWQSAKEWREGMPPLNRANPVATSPSSGVPPIAVLVANATVEPTTPQGILRRESAGSPTEKLEPLPVTQGQSPRKYPGIGRSAYLGSFFLICLLAVAAGEAAYFVGLLVLVPGSARLKNIGRHPAWCLLMIIPVISLIVHIPCLFFPAGYEQHRKLDLAAKIWLWTIGGFILLCFLAAMVDL